jgi:hypothetical protein
MADCRGLSDCWGQEDLRLRGTVLVKVTDTVDPSGEWKKEFEGASGLKAVLIIGNFCNADAVWYRLFPTTRKNLRIQLSVGPNGFKDLGG